ncbi:hypothetical protein BLA29_003888 [Euroglyphus maynei]|uniref:TLC domain-containing protein n=1 Tax=Euroglyphus maynei TaxID=6958 RepID=A0A1Y3B2D6_EURMA|nr:hypothetical protein BLA29_003888 [Euroglyphus maynei]
MLSMKKLGKYPDRIEIIIHHIITMITLMIVIIPDYSEIKFNPFQQFLPHCLFGLIIELSNIFIHIRSIGKISQFWSQYPDILHRFNSICAIVSIIIFRFYPLSKIWIDIYGNYYLKSNYIVTNWIFITITLLMLSFMFISIVILWRIIQEDFLTSSSNDCQSSTIPEREKSDTHQLANNDLKQIKKRQ